MKGVSFDPGIFMGSSRPPSETPDGEGEIVLEERPTTQEPRRYVVVFHNDDYTTQEFVIHVLMNVFHKDSTSATQIMLQVHHRGWGVAGIYSRDVAETKVEQVNSYARERGHPLKVTAEPEGYGEST
jgi:ATP-dependent Clp protease adaptor protein ClpS